VLTGIPWIAEYNVWSEGDIEVIATSGHLHIGEDGKIPEAIRLDNGVTYIFKEAIMLRPLNDGMVTLIYRGCDQEEE